MSFPENMPEEVQHGNGADDWDVVRHIKNVGRQSDAFDVLSNLWTLERSGAFLQGQGLLTKAGLCPVT
jgi:hypothetical protein